MDGLRQFVANNSLSIALSALFLVCVFAQALSGCAAYDQSLHSAHLPEISLAAYLVTGDFLDGVFSNWQAAILQLAVLIMLSSVLRQKGAAHSRRIDPPNYRALHWKLRRRASLREWLYANSLSLTFIAGFILLFASHLVFGEWKYNEDQALRRLPVVSLGGYAVSASFWSSVMECWEAEFGAMAVYILLSIYLRQEGSAESKPVEASNEQTGGANE